MIGPIVNLIMNDRLIILITSRNNELETSFSSGFQIIFFLNLGYKYG